MRKFISLYYVIFFSRKSGSHILNILYNIRHEIIIYDIIKLLYYTSQNSVFLGFSYCLISVFSLFCSPEFSLGWLHKHERRTGCNCVKKKTSSISHLK